MCKNVIIEILYQEFEDEVKTDAEKNTRETRNINILLMLQITELNQQEEEEIRNLKIAYEENIAASAQKWNAKFKVNMNLFNPILEALSEKNLPVHTTCFFRRGSHIQNGITGH